MKTAAIVYHRTDFDGICAYAVARKALERDGFLVTPYPFTYGDQEPDAQDLSHYDHVAVLDVCLAPETMRSLLAMTRFDGVFSVVWIDHHRTAIRASVKEGFSLMKGYRQEEGAAACELAWSYYNGSASAPKAIQLLAAHDIHDKDRLPWEDEVEPYQYGMRDAYALRAEEFVRDYDLIMHDEDFTRRMIGTGSVILRYSRESGERGVGTYGFPVTVSGTHRGLCCLTNAFGSLPFESQMRQDGIPLAVCANRVTPDRYRVSVYAPGECPLDLGEYMKEHYGGGGHRGAASGTLNLEQFVTLVTRQTL